MVKINSNDNNLIIKDTDPVKKSEKPAAKEPEKKLALQNQDNIKIKTDLTNNSGPIAKNADNIKLVDTSPLDKKGSEHPWRIKSMHVAYGLQDVRFSKSDINIKQPGYNTDVTLHNVEGEQRTSYTYIWGKPRFAPDEPEFNAQVAVEFENRFGLELDVKHNKYTVQKFDQNVLMTGTLEGQNINEVRPFNSIASLYDITAGNHQISLLATYSIPLPSPEGHHFSFNTKAGPSAIVSYSHNSLKNPQGDYVEIDRSGGLGFAGYGAMVENSLKYDLGRKLGGVTVELSHSLSYLNFTKVPVDNGAASQSMFASQFALTLGKTFDFSKKK